MNRPAPRRSTRRGNKWAVRITIAGLSVILLLAVLTYVTVVLGLVEGEEIATETFRRRTFSYYQLPVIQLQVSGIHRQDSTGDVENYLIDNKLIQVASPTSQPDDSLRWDLVNAHRFRTVFSRGEAEILCNYLDATTDDDKHVWVEWSKAHPNLAKVIWPAVVTVAQHELYIFVPELLELATNATDAQALADDVQELLTNQYLRVAATQQQLERHELAIELYSHALNQSPQHLAALQGRAESYAAVGKQQQADADRARARELQ